MSSKTWLVGLAVGAVLALGGASTAKAQNCSASTWQREQQELRGAIDNHGYNSRQANNQRGKIERIRERCGNAWYGNGWYRGNGDNDRDDRWRRDGDRDRDDRWRRDGDRDRDDRWVRQHRRDGDHDRDDRRDGNHDRDRGRDRDRDHDRH